MTDAERQACERIAVAMGIPGREPTFDETVIYKTFAEQLVYPDYFRDPVAFMALWEWLRAKPRDLEIGIHVEGRDDVDVYIAELDCPRCGMRGNMLDNSIMKALALAADAAIEEAERAV